MWHVLHLIARPIEVLLGAFCVLTAIVLYPNEEGKIQSKFEDFWIRVDDYQHLALSKHAAFMTQVAKLETRFLDRMFGHKLISSRAFGVSFSCSLAAVSIFIIVSTHQTDQNSSVKFASSCLIASIVLGGACIFLRRLLVLTPLLAIALLLVVSSLIEYRRGSMASVGVLAFAVVVLGGFVCDIAFLLLTRRLTRLAGEMTSSLRVILVVAINLFLAIFLISPYLAVERPFIGWPTIPESVSQTPDSDNSPNSELEYPVRSGDGFLDNSLLFLISLTNMFDAALALLFVLLALLLLVHRLFWPLLTRTLFRMTDIGTKGRRAILTTVGFALIAAGISGKVPELLQELVEKFGG